MLGKWRWLGPSLCQQRVQVAAPQKLQPEHSQGSNLVPKCVASSNRCPGTEIPLNRPCLRAPTALCWGSEEQLAGHKPWNKVFCLGLGGWGRKPQSLLQLTA